jgi:hypothetical protein
MVNFLSQRLSNDPLPALSPHREPINADSGHPRAKMSRQHVGDQLSARDFPRTLGTPSRGLRQFELEEVRSRMSDVASAQMAAIDRDFLAIGKNTFQIWGLPTGAAKTLAKIGPGDYFMALDTNAEWGAFKYIGRVLSYLPGEHWNLSQHLWKESKFPLILLLHGVLVKYPWHQFLSDFGYSAGFLPMGRTYRISKTTLGKSDFANDLDFFNYLVAQFLPAGEPSGEEPTRQARQ